jgi:hypothetical protein
MKEPAQRIIHVLTGVNVDGIHLEFSKKTFPFRMLPIGKFRISETLLSTRGIEDDRLTCFRVTQFQQTHIGHLPFNLVVDHDGDDVVLSLRYTKRPAVPLVLEIADQKDH